MRRHSRLSPGLLAAGLLLAGCGGAQAPGELVTSDKQRITSPSVPAGDLAAVARGNTELAVALYRQALAPGENLFFSPLSISQAFSMVYAGARGATEQQMAQALRFTLSQDRHHPAMNALDLALHARGGEGAPELRLVNSTWAQRGTTFEPAFLDVLAEQYGAGARVVDFSRDPEPLRTRINAWVAQQTGGRIEDLLPQGTLTTDTRLVLTNALYFKGSWARPFNKEATRSAPFHLLDGSTREVQMMSTGGGTFPRMRGEGFDALALPYKGDAFRMLLIVPDTGRFAEVEARLSADLLDGIRSALAPAQLDLRLPRFEVRTHLGLVEHLKALGMVDAFTESADLSGMTRQERLMLSAAEHQGFVSVDEAGTEAAAATAVGAIPVSLPEPLEVNRPFLLLIEEKETRAVLFLGRVLAP